MKFTILTHTHYSLGLWHLLPFCFKDNLHFAFKLNEGCWFPMENSDDYDVNKIFGKAYGNPLKNYWNWIIFKGGKIKHLPPPVHHTDSVRLGWVPAVHEGRICIYSYVYNKGKRGIEKMFEGDAGSEYECVIVERKKIDTITYHFLQNGKMILCQSRVFVFPKTRWSYYLFPFCGGQNKAKRIMKITIKLLK